MILFSLLPCMSGLHAVSWGRNRMHAVISVFIFHCPLLGLFTLLFSSFSLCYCLTISSLLLLGNFHTLFLRRSPFLTFKISCIGKNQGRSHPSNSPSIILAVNALWSFKEVKKWRKTESFKTWECFHFKRKKEKGDVRVRRDSLAMQNTKGAETAGQPLFFFSFFFQIKCRMAVEKLEQTTQNNRNSFSRNPQLYNLIARKYHWGRWLTKVKIYE